jgi:predicted ester cyclase
MVCMRWSSTATHTATGKPLQVTGISILRFKDGRLVEGWQNWDQYGMMQQLQDAAPKASFQTAG